MATALILVVTLVAVVNGDITGRSVRNGACLCFNGNSVNVRSSGKNHVTSVGETFVFMATSVHRIWISLNVFSIEVKLMMYLRSDT